MFVKKITLYVIKDKKSVEKKRNLRYHYIYQQKVTRKNRI